MNNELYHHGIKGMRWGIRRYQNPDGSLTPAGKKRLQQLDSEREALVGKKSSSSEVGAEKRTIYDLSNDEIQKLSTRQQNIKSYLESTKRINELTPKEVSRGKKFFEYVNKNILLPAATDAAKNFTTKFLNTKGDELLSGLTDKAKKKS